MRRGAANRLQVEAVRTLLNPKTGNSLDRLIRRIPDRTDAWKPSPTNRPSRARYGLIEQTCVESIIDAGREITIRAIHASVETSLGFPVSYSSVKNAVARLALRDNSGIKRVEPGIYRSDEPNPE